MKPVTFLATYFGSLPRVLVVHGSDSTASRYESELVAAIQGTLRERLAVERTRPTDLRSTLDETVVALVAVHDPPALDALSLVRDAAEIPADVPRILAASEPDELSVRDVFDAGYDDVVHRGEVDELADAVTTHVGEYVDRFESTVKRRALDALIDGLDDMAFLKDAEGRYLAYTTEWFGEDSANVLGRTDDELHEDRMDLGEREYELDVEALDSGEPIHWTVNEYGDDLHFYRESTRIPWFDDGGDVEGLLGISRLVTERVEREQRLERQRDQLEQFSSYVSHDLRNHLDVADGYAELAKEGSESPAFVDRVQGELVRIEEIIEDMDVLVSPTEEFGTSVDTVVLRTLVTGVWNGLETTDATLSLAFPDETVVRVAEHKVRPLFENLFKNAVEHGSTSPHSSSTREDAVEHGSTSPPSQAQEDTAGQTTSGEPSVADAPEDAVEHAGCDVTVTVGTTSDGFYIEDDGPGLPNPVAAAIEDGETATDDRAGTGLSIVETVAYGHGWDFEVVDGYDGGARFEFHNVPVVPSPNVSYREGVALPLTDETDVGNVRIAGAASHDTGTDTWVVSGAGSDVWRDDNEFHFVYATVDGDARIQCRIADLEQVNAYSKAGIMVRDSLDEDAVHQYVGRTAAAGLELLRCESTGGPTESYQLEQASGISQWVRLDREEDRVTCSASRDGEEWTVVEQRRLPFSGPVHLGLVVCSVIPGQLCEATFENVNLCRLEPDASSE